MRIFVSPKKPQIFCCAFSRFFSFICIDFVRLRGCLHLFKLHTKMHGTGPGTTSCLTQCCDRSGIRIITLFLLFLNSSGTLIYLLSASCLSFSVSKSQCVAGRAYLWERRVRGWTRSQTYDGEKAWSSIIHLILSVPPLHSPHLCFSDQRECMVLLEYQAMPSLRDVAHEVWLCTCTV